jgi:hypothetical protein
MSRLYKKYGEDQKPLECYLYNSKWFNSSGSFNPRGILLHDTSSNNEFLHRYVMPADNDPKKDELTKLLGKNPYGNDWNHGGKDKDAGVNAFVGTIADGKTVTSLITAPYNKRPWGCGGGRFGSLNDTHFQWEICQDDKKSVSYFKDVYEESIELAAYLCKLWKIDPHGTFMYKGYKIPTICCHWDAFIIGWNGIRVGLEGCKGGFGSWHTDIYDWDAMYDYLKIDRKEIYGKEPTYPYTVNPLDNPVFNRIRDDIEKAMQDEPEPVHADGWVRTEGKWYYYSGGKLVKSNWVKYKGSWYYMGADGAMLTGWQTIKGTKYYLDDSGVMAQDEWIDGKFADMSGAVAERGGEWHDEERGRWFGDGSGWYPKNRVVRIDGTDYRFNASGYVVD